MRDEFNAATKDLLARRVSFRCSNPDCRWPTAGSQADPAGSVNIGVAAHITAASPDGPRYDPTLTPDERSRRERNMASPNRWKACRQRQDALYGRTPAGVEALSGSRRCP